MARKDRKNNEIRKTKINPHYLENPDGSALIKTGKTIVICTAMVEESLPPWIENNKDLSQGWLTARYSMLPGSGDTRIRRERKGARGRTKEIQRLIGRSLRTCLDLEKIGERTIWIDCDVLQADGGTRTASITGAWIALRIAVNKLLENELIEEDPIIGRAAATSVGLVDGDMLLDLNFKEDSNADVDMNVIMNSENNFIEIQASGEEAVFTREEHEKMISLAEKGITDIFKIQEKVLSEL
ncbi:MAG: ribonuclease PH [Thermoplasmatota archaeon]